jgi:hypothetical protein
MSFQQPGLTIDAPWLLSLAAKERTILFVRNVGEGTSIGCKSQNFL